MTSTSASHTLLGRPVALWLRAGVIPVWLGSLFVGLNAVVVYVSEGQVGMDAHSYWWAGRTDHPYAVLPDQAAYLYSPAFAQALHPLALLPWPAFLTLWMVAESLVLGWLLRPLGWRYGIPALLWCLPEILIGNVYGFLALAVVVGLRPNGPRPGAWALPILTKLTPGVGLLWHPLRRQWRAFGVGLAVTAGIGLLSYAAQPHLWHEWVAFLRAGAPGRRGHGGDGSRLLRYAVAPILLGVAARRGWPWLVPAGVLLALPVIDGNAVLALLAAVPRLATHNGTAYRVGNVTP